ncbi:MAG: glycosyltransferase [Pseudooceanicola nanhaiensis]
MIFVTVGTQLPFDRLIAAMDAYAARSGEEVIAQVGGEGGSWAHLDSRAMLEPSEFVKLFGRARVVVGHAGVGTILSAKRYRRPLVVLPRRLIYGEHRNDHQLAMARALKAVEGIHVAWQVDEIAPLLAEPALSVTSEAPGEQAAALISGVAAFIGAPGYREAPVKDGSNVVELELSEEEEDRWPLSDALTGATKNSAGTRDRRTPRSRRSNRSA